MNDTIWISHSAIFAFSRCPHLYYLQYKYRNPSTGNRIQVVNPYLSLGLAVHQTIEELVDLPVKERVKISLEERFEKMFKNYHGLKGGFISKKKEEAFKKRGLFMVKKVEKSSLLHKPSTKTDTDFPVVNLTEDGSMKLVGNLDWIEVLPGKKAHIIDFKTGNNKENNNSLQLPIYAILAQNNLSRDVEKLSYWYLQHDDHPTTKKIDNLPDFMEEIKKHAYKIKEALDRQHFPCSYSGNCFACGDYEKIFEGEAEMVEKGSGYKKDLFCVFKEKDIIEKVLEEDFLDTKEKKVFDMRMEHPMERVSLDLGISKKDSDKITMIIKDKLKKNLSNGELKVLVRVLENE